VNVPGRHREDDSNLVPARALTSHPDRQDGTVDTYVTTLRAEYGEQCLRGDGADPLIAFDWMAAGSDRTRTVSPGDYARSNGTRNRTALSGEFGVRRLTPLECERLMGWPDEWTRWATDDREIADSHRYRMCGNGVVATVAEWLGHRLVAAHAFGPDRSD
jgi:site-specific DNA-cytosine methylase